MSEQTEMLMQLNIARRLVSQPSKLTGKELKQYRSIADNIADRCHFNCGWYAAQPGKPLPGSASTEKISSDLQVLTAAILPHALPPKRPKAGAPPKEASLDGPYLFVIADYVSRDAPKTMIECVRQAIADGLLDKKTKDPTHIRRIERFMEKARKETHASNVIPFPKGGKPANKNLK